MLNYNPAFLGGPIELDGAGSLIPPLLECCYPGRTERMEATAQKQGNIKIANQTCETGLPKMLAPLSDISPLSLGQSSGYNTVSLTPETR